MSLIISVLLAWVFHSYALPVGPTGPSEPAYVPNPPGRGTVDLILSCILTLILCVWTAIHINIFPTGTKLRVRILWKTVWALTALFAPEFVLWTAFMQWRNAKKIQMMRNEILKKVLEEEHKLSGKDFEEEYNRQAWTLHHGFFATMGGFEIAVEEKYDWILSRGQRTLTEVGVKSFSRLELLPVINVESIKARSKADQLAKILVCFQAVWMVIQAVARKATGLPVTLLELNTLAHVGCAVVMYGLWWYKPQNVEEPQKTTVSDPIVALLLVGDELPFESFEPILSQQQGEFDISKSTYPPRTSNVPPRSQSQKHDEIEHGKREGLRGRFGSPSTAVRQNDVGNIRSGLPTSTHPLSGYKVIGKPGSVPYPRRPSWEEYALDFELRSGSNLVLLPGQSISGIPFQHRLGNVAAFLNKRDIQLLELMRDTEEAL